MFDATSPSDLTHDLTPFGSPEVRGGTPSDNDLQRAEGFGRALLSGSEKGSRIVDIFQRSPIRIMFPGAGGGAVEEAVLVNTAGGISGGDRLECGVTALANASIAVTSQAAEKIYRALNEPARIATKLKACEAAKLAWLPQETIVMSALNDKVVVVTGGSSGIGRATALSFAEQGANVLITARRAVPLEATAVDHPNIVGLVADAAAPDDAARTIAKAVDTWGRLDVLVHNAGAGAILPLADATADRIMEIFAVNVLGPSLLSAAALPYLASAKGTIINISSTFGHKPVAGLSHYAASKAALEHLTRCWALELAPSACASTRSQRGRPNRAR